MLTMFLSFLDDDNDKKLFENIYLSFRKQMATIALTILHNESDAEDAVSEVFLRIAQHNWDTVRLITDPNDLRNYLLKATKNTSLNKIKEKGNQNFSLDTDTAYNFDDIEDLTDDTFLDVICNRFEYDKILTAIISLDPKYRDVLYCHFVLEMTISQTSKYLGKTLSSTKQQLVRGKKILLKSLGV